MKKLSIIMTALAMLLAMTQCKKNDEPNPAGTGGEPVNITLEVKGDGNGAKVAVDPSTGTVNFENGDALYVASGGKYVGTLTYNGTVFSGAISNAVEGAPLQFYFLGNVTPAETLTSGVTESCSVVISDQTLQLPVISAAASNENYLASQPSYTARLLNKCALVKFNVTTSSSAATCITGMNNKMAVNFSENTMTSSRDGAGLIKLAAGNGEKWAVLLSQEALGEGVSGSAYSGDCDYSGIVGAVPVILENAYLPEGIAVNIDEHIGNQNNIPGVFGSYYEYFTIHSDPSYSPVLFSQGNLQYQASTGIWRFADSQYDFLGYENANISPDYDGWIDLFGWGTSGWNNGNTYYRPWNYEVGNLFQGYGYGPTDGTNYYYNLTGVFAESDWGIFNGISNGANVPNQWRTLTREEWDYLLNQRETNGGIRFAKAKVCDVCGILLLPDYWNPDYFTHNVYLNNPNDIEADFSSNVITEDEWYFFENYGAVFLPASGYRNENQVDCEFPLGFYWTATASYNNAYGLCFDDQEINVAIQSRSCGCSVRLVRDVR